MSEAACVALIWGAWMQFGWSYAFVAASLFCMTLVLLAVIDAEHTVLPDELTLGLLWGGLAFSLLKSGSPFATTAQAVAGAIAGYLLLWAINLIWRIARKCEAIGQGDWKLLAALGAWIGVHGLFGAVAAAMITGCGWSIGTMLRRKWGLNEQVPFGPFLALGGAWALLDPWGI